LGYFAGDALIGRRLRGGQIGCDQFSEAELISDWRWRDAGSGFVYSHRRRPAHQQFSVVEFGLHGAVFLSDLWPEFGQAQLDTAIAQFARRERRYGLDLAQVAASAPPLMLRQRIITAVVLGPLPVW